MILLDFSQVMYSIVLSQSGGSPLIDESLLRHMVLNSIRHIKSKFGSEYGHLVICYDSHSWRKNIFEHYKAKRKSARKKHDVNWSKMFNIFEDIKNELNISFPYVTISVDGAEADDIISVIIQNRDKNSDEKHLIVSDDKDFYQLHYDKNIWQYHPRKKIIINKTDTRIDDIIEKVMCGDAGDGIPNVLSDDDCFVDETQRQKPLTSKRKKLIRSEILYNDKTGILCSKNMPPDIEKNIIRNERLIVTAVPNYLDLYCSNEEWDEYGKNLKITIEQTYQFKISTRIPSLKESLDYCIKHGLNQHVDSILEFGIGEGNQIKTKTTG